MRLTDEENAHLTSYLLTLKKEGVEGPPPDPSKEEMEDPELAKKGLGLMGSLGCHGCHVIPGLENRPRVGAELTTFGDKDLELLFFGYAKHVPHNWWDWTLNKIKNPQVYATERIEQKMPNFYLSDEEAQTLVVLLHSFRAEEKEIPLHYRKILSQKEEDIEVGRNLVRHLNCTGCHMIEGKGSDIAPTLQGEGKKVQPEWLFKFLKDPISIRPWLNVRMPRFNLTDEDAAHLVSYFSALSDAKYPYEFFDHLQVPERERKAGEKLFEMFKCMSCHPVSIDPATKGTQVVNLGPNLGLSKDRLRHDWIARWILEPEVIQPGTKMPTNFPKMGDKRVSYVPNLLKSPQYQELKKYFEDLFGPELDAFLADPAWQTRAIRDHVVSLKSERGAQEPQPVLKPQVLKESAPEPKVPPPSSPAQEEEW
jgi:mono/diheme cytochrome c family protein